MEVTDKDIRDFQVSIRDYSRYDFSEYSLTSLKRRLTKILLEYDMEMEQLTSRLKRNPVFLETTVKKLTVHTTELFRDPDIWKKIRGELLPSLRERSTIHIWHPGCSTGQEVYSMMMVLDDLGMFEKSMIYGSDLNPDVIETARLGRYKYHFNQSYLENFKKVLLNGSGEGTIVEKKQWKKYFTVDEARDTIQMNQFLINKPFFRKMDLVKDDNLFMVKFDLIVCRNVIIYFNTELQNKVFGLFHESLTDTGTLLLGIHESIMGPYARQFIKRDPFYQKQPA
jgi:chemotaxis protein methyltransferase CheR